MQLLSLYQSYFQIKYLFYQQPTRFGDETGSDIDFAIFLQPILDSEVLINHNSLTFIGLINLCFLPLARQNVACLILDCVEIKLEIIQLPTGRSAGQVSQKIYNSSF